jgi:hypothetical protein
MRRTSVVRFLTSVIIASFMMAGPLAPLAHAQQPAPAAEPAPTDTAQAQQVDTAQSQPMAQVQPVAPPPPTQPDLFEEKLKGERGSDRSQGIYTAQAVVVNIFLVPGRAITCAAGAIVGVTILAVSLGSGYRPATAMFNEGCGGKWIVKGDDLRPDTSQTMIVTDPVR